jgi:hypothetical protein
MAGKLQQAVTDQKGTVRVLFIVLYVLYIFKSC